MGYYATGSGNITFKVLPEDVYDKIKDALNATFEYDGERTFKTPYGECTYFDIWTDEKYYQEEVEETLNTVAALADIESGELCYHGEDDSLWRFVWKDGKWQEENGEVIYSAGFSNPTIVTDAFRMYLEKTLPALEPEKVREFLVQDCGLCESDLNALGVAGL